MAVEVARCALRRNHCCTTTWGVLVHCFIQDLLPDVYSLDRMRRWAAGHLSDAPELTPLVPLGDFVTQPGKPPSEEVAHNCFSTLTIGRG